VGGGRIVYVDLDMLPGTKIYKLRTNVAAVGALSEPLTSCIRAFNRAPRRRF